MSGRVYPISVDLNSSDAAAAVLLRATLQSLCAADPRLGFDLGPVNEVTLKGADELHLDIIIDRLRREFHIAFEAGGPQVAYREAITRAALADYTHKKQIGGRGYYARVQVRFDPGEPGSGFVFTDATARGDLRPEFVPAVERGLREAAAHGPVAGFPLMDLACTLVQGNYHEVDSTPETFEIAARACLREALPKAGPRLLEPVMKVEVVTPADCLGDVIGDLHSRRGEVRGMETRGEARIIMAMVPLANMFGYPWTLRSMTRGRAEYSMTFSHYEQLSPPPSGNDDPFAPAAALR